MFLRDKGLSIKALILLNSTLSHTIEDVLKSEDGEILTMYLPPNLTPLEEPIKLTKLYCRNNLLPTVIENDTNISDNSKKLTIKDAVINLTAAWNHLDPEIIKKCWRNILDEVCLNLDHEENVPFSLVECQLDNKNSVSESLELLPTLAPQVGPFSL